MKEQTIDAFIIVIEWCENFNIVDVDREIIENMLKRATCAFVIKINKYDDSVDAVIDLNVIEKIKREFDELMWLFSLSTKRCLSVLSDILLCRRTCSWNLLFDANIFSQCLHVKFLEQFFCVWVNNRDVDENWASHSRHRWYFCDEESIIVWSKLISEVDENEKVFVMIVLKSFNEVNLSWYLSHCNAEPRRHWKKTFNMLFFLYLTANSIKWYRKLALLTEMRNSSQRSTCIVGSKKFIFLGLVVSGFAASVAAAATATIGSAGAGLGEIDREEVSFELFETGMKTELVARGASDWITISNSDSVGAELELKLIVNSSDLNDLKVLLNFADLRDLIFSRGSSLAEDNSSFDFSSYVKSYPLYAKKSYRFFRFASDWLSSSCCIEVAIADIILDASILSKLWTNEQFRDWRMWVFIESRLILNFRSHSEHMTRYSVFESW